MKVKHENNLEFSKVFFDQWYVKDFNDVTKVRNEIAHFQTKSK